MAGGEYSFSLSTLRGSVESTGSVCSHDFISSSTSYHVFSSGEAVGDGEDDSACLRTSISLDYISSNLD